MWAYGIYGDITMDPGWALNGPWICVQVVEVGTPPADWGSVPGLFRGSRFAAVVKAYQDLAQIYCDQSGESGTVR